MPPRVVTGARDFDLERSTAVTVPTTAAATTESWEPADARPSCCSTLWSRVVGAGGCEALLLLYSGGHHGACRAIAGDGCSSACRSAYPLPNAEIGKYASDVWDA